MCLGQSVVPWFLDGDAGSNARPRILTFVCLASAGTSLKPLCGCTCKLRGRRKVAEIAGAFRGGLYRSLMGWFSALVKPGFHACRDAKTQTHSWENTTYFCLEKVKESNRDKAEKYTTAYLRTSNSQTGKNKTCSMAAISHSTFVGLTFTCL